jgi:Capsule assembly protein Wzi
LLSSLFSTGNDLAGSPDKPGDRRSGLDFSYKIPKLRKWLLFYGDGFTDDEFSPIAYFDRSVWHAGIYVPQIPGINRLDMRAEGVYTDNPLGGLYDHGYFYFNTTWRSGYTNGGTLIGNWIGRQGQGAQAWTTYHFSPRNFLQLNFRHQKVSQHFISGGGTLSDIGLKSDFTIRREFGISSLFQYETWRVPVIASTLKNNVTASIQFNFWPSRRKY